MQQLERQLNIAKEKLVRLEKHQQSKQETNEGNLARLKADYQAVSEERSAAQLKVDENEAHIAELEREVYWLTRWNSLMKSTRRIFRR
jgi:septal ring factor EnvC (AmiA/AmiB activator)